MPYCRLFFMLGCTPLHWAVLRGNVEACTVLVHAGTKQELMVKDNAGFTPLQLAYDKGHRHIALFLVRIVFFPISHFAFSSCKTRNLAWNIKTLVTI